MEDINRDCALVELGIEPSKKETDLVVYLKNDSSKHYIYSKYNPRKTARELIDFENANEETIWIIFGVGLGYVAEEILETAGRNSSIIMLEPTADLLERQKPYMNKLLKDKRICMFCGSEQSQLKKLLEEKIKVKDINNIKFIVQPVYRNYFKTYYQYILAVISEHIENLKVTYNTFKTFSYTNIENIIKNKGSILDSYNMFMEKDKYKDIPAVIVSAGPSLNKNINALKDFKGVIFTGTRSLPNIKEIGVDPDFLVCVDPREIASDIMRDYKENEISLIATEEASPEVIGNNKGKKYFVKGMANGLSQTLYGIELPQLPLYGSVATLCISAAHFMGCNPIIFIGQDLAYTDAKAHVDDYKSLKVNLEDKYIRYVQGIDGHMIPTDVKLLSFLRWIESFIAEHSQETQYINCTEGGANIRGTKVAPFKEVIGQYGDNSLCETRESVHKVKSTLQAKEEVVISLKAYMKVLEKGIKYVGELQEAYKMAKGIHRVNELLGLLEKEVSKKLENMNSLMEMVFTIERLHVEVDLQYKNQFNDTQEEKNIKSTQKLLIIYSHTYDKVQKIIEIIEGNENE